jgi:pyruvate/2-oxoglutarate dehydrogenase complex dihydrolipoamide acyltransferase (E2) component
MIDVVVPSDLWDTDQEGVIVTWLYSTGATVEEGHLIAELAVEKAQIELIAPASGKLTVLAPADTVITKGQVIGRIEPD